MEYIRKIFYKFLDYVQGKPVLGGLEISDSAIRFAYFDGKIWKLESVKIPPSILKDGELNDRAKFVEILGRLKSQIPIKEKLKKKISVVVSFSFPGIYSQVFSLPKVSDKNLEEAVGLNLQMSSPIQMADSYSGWQVIGKDENSMKIDVLSVFIGKKPVDGFSSVLREVGFSPVAAESKALSLVRLAREQAIGFNQEKPCVLMILDNESLNLIIVRKGEFYFEYYNSWAELRGDKKEISLTDFKTLITSKLRQVLNFYSQHWSEQMTNVQVVSLGLKEEIKGVVRDNFSIAATDLQLRFDKPLETEWYASLGAAIRARIPRRLDQDLSLLGASAKDEFRKDQIAGFLSFWRVFMPTAFGVIMLVFILAYGVLMSIQKDLEAKAGDPNSSEIVQVQVFKKDADNFNALVNLIGSVRKFDQAKSPVFQKLISIMESSNLTLGQFSFSGFDTNLVLTGRAALQEDILGFAEKLEKDGQFKVVPLSPTNVKSDDQGFSYSINFSVMFPKSE